MEKKIRTGLIAASAAVLALILLNFVLDPLQGKRAWLQAELAQVPDVGRTLDMALAANAIYGDMITDRSLAWGMLVARPERAVQQKAPQRPDIEKLLAGVEVTRFKVGDRIKIITKSNPDGGFYGIGDKVQGCTLVDFTRLDATFTYHWAEGNEMMQKRLPRQ